MAHDFIQFMEDALDDPNLLTRFETEFNGLFDADGTPLNPAATPSAYQQLSDWFDGEGYNISNGQCKKLASPMAKAKNKSPITAQY
jgi:hypothetical protein